jgi:hypothetical protein
LRDDGYCQQKGKALVENFHRAVQGTPERSANGDEVEQEEWTPEVTAQ